MVITDIKNCKISVENKYHFNSILFAAKLLGYKENCKGLGHTNAGNLFFHNDMRVGFTSDYDWFCDHEYEEIWFYNGEFHDKPQDEIEWRNGDECVCEYFDHERNKGDNLIYVSVHPTHKDHSIVYAKYVAVPYFSVATSMLSKPISKEEIERQERLEAAYDLYLCGWHEGVKGWGASLSFKDFCLSVESNHMGIDYLAIVDKTGYRKGEL